MLSQEKIFDDRDEWRLLADELSLLPGMTDTGRLGFALQLKFRQVQGHYPDSVHDFPSGIVHTIAEQVGCGSVSPENYPFQGRQAQRHRQHIRRYLGFSPLYLSARNVYFIYGFNNNIREKKMAGGNSIGGGSQFGNMGPNDPYGNGGGSSGNNKPGGNSGGNGSSGGTSGTPAQKKQASDIRNDPVIRQKLVELTRKAQLMNPAAKVSIDSVSATGVMEVSITGLDVSQASTIGLSGLIGLKTVAGNFTFGKIETGYKIPGTGQQHGSAVGNLVSEVIEEENKKNRKPSLDERVAKYYSDRPSRKALMNLYNETLRTGKIPAAARGNLLTSLQSMLAEDKKLAAAEAVKKQDEKDAILKTSEIIADVGEKLNKQLGAKYKTLANEIAGDIRNFQGKNIRNFNDAIKSMNKVTSNPSMKINKADKDAIVNAWKHVNAQDMANKLGNLSRTFKAVDTVMKVEKVREKSIIGYETGNWGPLVLEIESWVVSGIAAGVALGLLGSIVSTFLIAGSFPATAAMIIGILVISLLASLIDDKVVDKINNEIIRPAH